MPLVDLPDLPARLERHQRLLGLDIGMKTIGLALSDVELTIATPLETIRRVKFTPDVQGMIAIARKQGVGGLVLGLPINMDGTEGPRAQSVRAFARSLAPLTEMPFALVDERMSTQAVTRALMAADASRARRAELVDKMAAAYILQNALDQLRHMEQERRP